MIDDRLNAGFPPKSYEDWRLAARKAIDGKDLDAELVSYTLDGIRIEPIYARAASGANLARSQAGGWTIDQLHADSDPAEANAAILDDLAAGAGAVTLQLAVPGQHGLPPRYEAIAAALQGVALEAIAIGVRAGDQYIGAAQCLASLWDAAGLAGARCRAHLDADPLGHLAATGRLEAEIWSALEVLAHFVRQNADVWPGSTLLLADGGVYHEAGASEAEELAAMLATLVEYLRALDYEGLRPDRTLRTMAIGLAADVDLFLTIAKLRAARLLIGKVAQACGAGNIRVHVPMQVTTSARMLSRRDVHVNTLRSTVAAAGAVLGGADSLAVRPHTWPLGRPDAAARRLARNIQIVLMEEAALGRVADPAAGSGYVDDLTGKLAAAAWALFQEIERGGGMAKCLLSGSFAERVAATAERRAAEIRDGKRSLTGVTAFVNRDDRGPAVEPHPAAAGFDAFATEVRALPPRRLAAEFEAGGS